MLKKNIVNLRLAVFIAISLCFGIITAYFFKLNNVILGVITSIIFLVLTALFFLFFFDKTKLKRNSIFVVVFILFFVVGFFSFNIQTNQFEKADLNGHYFAVQGKIVETEPTDNGKAVVLSNVNVKGVVKGSLKYKIMLYVYGESSLDIGDVISFSATLKDRSLTFENSLSPYNVANGIKYTASAIASDIEIVTKSLTVFEKFNLFIRETLQSGLDDNEFSIAYAMLTGNAELMDDNIITSYRYLGIAHIFAVSGLHIGFLATALSFLLDKLKTRKILKALIITAILIFYSGVCGFTASSVRATIMSAVMLFLSAKGERYDGLSAVSIAGVLILLTSPVQLFCVGFQLSFVVVIGILLLAKPVERILINKVKFIPRKISSSIGVVLSAQLSSIPVSLMHFGYFSPISIIVNFIAIPIIGMVFYLLFTFTIIGGIFSISHVSLFPINYVLKLINYVLTALDSEKLLISGIVLGGFAVFYYLAMIISSGVINIKKKTKAISVIVAVTIFFTGSIALNVAQRDYASIYVCGSNSASVTVISTNKENVMVISDVDNMLSLGNLRRLSNRKGIFDIDSVIFGGGFDYDMQVIVSRLNQLFNLSNVYYYGEKDTLLELVMLNSFPDISVTAFNVGEKLPTSSIDCLYTEDGLAVDMNVKGNRVVALSTQDNFSGYFGIYGKIDLLIAGQNLEQLNYQLEPTKLVAFRETTAFDDGESNGNFSLVFK